MPVGSMITYTVSGLVKASATGLTNTATISGTPGLTEPTGNNSATDTDSVNTQADLAVIKTADVVKANAGDTVIFTVDITNSGGPSDAFNVVVTDILPSGVTFVTGSGDGTYNAVSGIWNVGTILVDASATIEITVTVSGIASGTVINTATILSSSITDSNTGNDSDSGSFDVPSLDLNISKRSEIEFVNIGGTTTFIVTVRNLDADDDATNVVVVDTFPPGMSLVTGTFTGSASKTGASGTTSITFSGATVTVTIDRIPHRDGGSPTGFINFIRYQYDAKVDTGFFGQLKENNVLITALDQFDSNTGNNKSDSFIIIPKVDMIIDKDDFVTSVIAGTTVTYTIKVTNSGPHDATGGEIGLVRITDTFPSSKLSGISWTATQTGGATGFTSAGTGDIDDTGVSMPAGSMITYIVSGVVRSSATGSLINIATVSGPSGDPNTGNNSDDDIDTILAQPDLAITKSDGTGTVVPGSSVVTYIIKATNLGPSAATGVKIKDSLPSNLSGISWTATGTGGAVGFSAAGTGDINDSGITMPVGSMITYTVSGLVKASATGLTNTATISGPLADPNTGNNSATDTDNVNVSADLSITK